MGDHHLEFMNLPKPLGKTCAEFDFEDFEGEDCYEQFSRWYDVCTFFGNADWPDGLAEWPPGIPAK